jgi:hypothetical protein
MKEGRKLRQPLLHLFGVDIDKIERPPLGVGDLQDPDLPSIAALRKNPEPRKKFPEP